jgi:DNA repair protein RecO
MKEYIKTSGIILKNSASKENSAAILALTPDFGIIKFDKHGYSSAKNDARSVLQALNLTELHLEKHRGLYKLIDCTLTNEHQLIKSDYNKTQTALSVFKTLSGLDILEGEDHKLVFMLAKKFLDSLDSSRPCPYTVVMYFFYQFVWCLGVSFGFRDTKEPNYCYLQTDNGLFFQKRTQADSASVYRISQELYERLKHFQEIKFADIHKLHYITVKEFNEFREMYRKYTGYHLNRQVFISNIDTAEA